MLALPADHNVISPLPKLDVLPSGKLFPPETPVPLSGDWKVFAPVSSVHPIVSEVAALPAVVHATVEST
jgi:hypothetical protein